MVRHAPQITTAQALEPTATPILDIRFDSQIPNDITSVQTIETSLHLDYANWDSSAAAAAAAMARHNLPARSDRILQCRRVMMCSYAQSDNSLISIFPSRCRDRLCPYCSYVSRRSRAAEMANVVDKMRQPMLVTLTICRDEATSLSADIKRLYRAWSALRRRQLYKQLWRSGVWVLEISWSTTLGHPHLHCIIDSPYIPQNQLSHDWHQITNDSMIVDIRRLTHGRQAARYISGYICKPSQDPDPTNKTQWAAAITLSGIRTFGYWGFSRLRRQALRAERLACNPIVRVISLSQCWHRRGAKYDSLREQILKYANKSTYD